MSDLISRQYAIEIIQSMYPGMPGVPWMRKEWKKRYEPYIRTENAIRELPSAEPDVKPISYKDCVFALLAMWIENVLTDREYDRIMNRLTAHGKRRTEDERQ